MSRYSDKLSAFLDGELPEAEAREIEAALDRLAETLIEHESLEGDALDAILADAGGSVENSPAGATNHPVIDAAQPAEHMRAEGND